MARPKGSKNCVKEDVEAEASSTKKLCLILSQIIRMRSWSSLAFSGGNATNSIADLTILDDSQKNEAKEPTPAAELTVRVGFLDNHFVFCLL